MDTRKITITLPQDVIDSFDTLVGELSSTRSELLTSFLKEFMGKMDTAESTLVKPRKKKSKYYMHREGATFTLPLTIDFIRP